MSQLGDIYRDLYRVAKSDYEGHCTYCHIWLAGQLKLTGWNICKKCDQDIISGKLDIAPPVFNDTD